MDNRLKAAGYATKPIFISGSLPSYLIVTLNGAELPGSRHTLATPAGSGDAAFLAAEREAFDDAEQFAWEHAHKGGTPPWEGEAEEIGVTSERRADDYEDGPDPQCGTCHGKGCADCREAAAMGLPGHAAAADPKDATIAALAQEVRKLEQLASDKAFAEGWPEGYTASQGARSRLRRLGLALAAGLLASGLWAAPAGPQAPARAPRHVTRPLSSITVKVMPHAAFQGRFRAIRAAWAITTADADSCAAWVDGAMPGIEAAELAAFKGCRAAVDRAVDAAHAAAEKGGAK